MTRARFPGKPSRNFSRKKTTSNVYNQDYEGSKAAEDIYQHLKFFISVFGDDDEASSFHGFSPHDVKIATKKTSASLKIVKKEVKERGFSAELFKLPEILPYPRYCTEENKLSKSPIRNLCPNKVLSPSERIGDLKNGTESVVYKRRIGATKVSTKREFSFNETRTHVGGPALSGKFVLPSRSVHSSRVIKPNKKFIENESGPSGKKGPNRVILRKPRLQLKPEAYSPVEGPFSAAPSSVLISRIPAQIEGRSTVSLEDGGRVACGVCGSSRQAKQASKFGVVSCSPCRKFILRILKLQRQHSLQPLNCSSGNGSCNMKDNEAEGGHKCAACWLRLCLSSYSMPLHLRTSLQAYLPLTASTATVTRWTEVGRSLSFEAARNIKKRATAIARHSHAPAQVKHRTPGEVKGKWTPLRGPRVKHVCRSASLVLGQPPATKPCQEGKKVLERAASPLRTNREEESGTEDSTEPGDTVASEGVLTKPTPIARMLQDLGRVNWELLGGMEGEEWKEREAKVWLDFWESYDPEEVVQTGFPLLAHSGFTPRPLCFLCGSAGRDKLVHCAVCCEPYHGACASGGGRGHPPKVGDWLCPRCSECQSCLRSGGHQLTCASCSASYHLTCIPSSRFNPSDLNWLCPSCVKCKSCGEPAVHVYVGNLPLCRPCFKLRKKGSFCPLCQRCYDDNDYTTKMMECGECKSWIHAQCEGLSSEKYQVLSLLPSSVEFVCRLCCKSPPAAWSLAVDRELRAGFLNVVQALSKSKTGGALLKSGGLLLTPTTEEDEDWPEPRLAGVRRRLASEQYTSLEEFHRDMERTLAPLHSHALSKEYQSILKQVFPWFNGDECCITEDKTGEGERGRRVGEGGVREGEVAVGGGGGGLMRRGGAGRGATHEYYYYKEPAEDTRACVLCRNVGEGAPSREERLLYCGNNEWVHANCALWSSEVFEEVDGSLQNVQSAVSRARLIRCSHCGKKGASVGCCARSCPIAYHLGCALDDQCIFLDNKEVYCKNHSALTESKPLHRPEDFPIVRCVYVELDQRRRKDVPRQQVRLVVGSLYIESFGDIVPELSDHPDFLVPSNFVCSRLFWSNVEPWRIVRYTVRTKVVAAECRCEVDVNYTVAHCASELTPPLSPECDQSVRTVDEDQVRSVVSQLVDTVCSREDEAPDLLPPEVEAAIFQDLPRDLLDGISLQDIFPKMMEIDDCKEEKGKFLRRMKRGLPQLDGAMDMSESDEEVQGQEEEEEKPVKCGRCHRTYRTRSSYQRHTTSCNEDTLLSGSSSSESEPEENTSCLYISIPEEKQEEERAVVVQPCYVQQPLLLIQPAPPPIPVFTPSSLLITNPLYLETVVSNTVMSSSQYMSSPGVLAASSFSATTTQVFQAAAKPLELPHHGYVVVNTPAPCIPVYQAAPPPPTPWPVQTYQTVTIHEEKEVDGVKTINSTRETIVIEPEVAAPVKELSKLVDQIGVQPKQSSVKIVELPNSSAVEKPQQAVAPLVVKRVEETKPQPSFEPEPEPEPEEKKKVEKAVCKVATTEEKTVKEEPKITYEITSEDGFSYTTSDALEAWQKVFETVQVAREGKGLPPLPRNPFPSPESMLKKMMGLGSKSTRFIVEQLPGAGRCSRYTPLYHRRELSALEHALRATVENPSGAARAEPYTLTSHSHDMFSWLASRHRRPPKLLAPENDLINSNRRVASVSLPMAMRFRHLKETSKQAVGVFRSDIHGRGLFCLRDIEPGEMVIEYAGEVIRSALTDLRERYYTARGIGCYMFRIDDKFVVDATMKGNAARFINHSCEPNCYSRVVDILGKKHILIFALRRIPQGEELTYDYKFPLEEEKISCHCLSRKCRKYLN